MRIINIEKYFPIHLIVLGYGLATAGFFMIFTQWYLAIVFLPIGILFSTTRHGFLIDRVNHRYHEYISIFWIKTAKVNSFEEIQCAYIQSSNYSYSYGSVGMRNSVDHKELKGFLKFSDTEKIHVGTGTRKELRSTFNFLAGSNVEIVDYTIE